MIFAVDIKIYLHKVILLWIIHTRNIIVMNTVVMPDKQKCLPTNEIDSHLRQRIISSQ